MVERNSKALDAAPGNADTGPLFFFGLGFLMAVDGYISSQGTRSFSIIIGCAFAVFGALAFVRNSNTYRWRGQLK
jgi:hypothetical protein